MLAFPVSVATVNEKNAKAWRYGDTTFVGAYVYEITLENGFVLKAKLSELSEDDWKKMGSYYWSGDKDIDRLIYIGDVLYTISDNVYSAYDMKNGYEKVGRVEI